MPITQELLPIKGRMTTVRWGEVQGRHIRLKNTSDSDPTAS